MTRHDQRAGSVLVHSSSTDRAAAVGHCAGWSNTVCIGWSIIRVSPVESAAGDEDELLAGAIGGVSHLEDVESVGCQRGVDGLS